MRVKQTPLNKTKKAKASYSLGKIPRRHFFKQFQSKSTSNYNQWQTGEHSEEVLRQLGKEPRVFLNTSLDQSVPDTVSNFVELGDDVIYENALKTHKDFDHVEEEMSRIFENEISTEINVTIKKAKKRKRPKKYKSYTDLFETLFGDHLEDIEPIIHGKSIKKSVDKPLNLSTKQLTPKFASTDTLVDTIFNTTSNLIIPTIYTEVAKESVHCSDLRTASIMDKPVVGEGITVKNPQLTIIPVIDLTDDTYEVPLYLGAVPPVKTEEAVQQAESAQVPMAMSMPRLSPVSPDQPLQNEAVLPQSSVIPPNYHKSQNVTILQNVVVQPQRVPMPPSKRKSTEEVQKPKRRRSTQSKAKPIEKEVEIFRPPLPVAPPAPAVPPHICALQSNVVTSLPFFRQMSNLEFAEKLLPHVTRMIRWWKDTHAFYEGTKKYFLPEQLEDDHQRFKHYADGVCRTFGLGMLQDLYDADVVNFEVVQLLEIIYQKVVEFDAGLNKLKICISIAMLMRSYLNHYCTSFWRRFRAQMEGVQRRIEEISRIRNHTQAAQAAAQAQAQAKAAAQAQAQAVAQAQAKAAAQAAAQAQAKAAAQAQAQAAAQVQAQAQKPVFTDLQLMVLRNQIAQYHRIERWLQNHRLPIDPSRDITLKNILNSCAQLSKKSTNNKQPPPYQHGPLHGQQKQEGITTKMMQTKTYAPIASRPPLPLCSGGTAQVSSVVSNELQRLLTTSVPTQSVTSVLCTQSVPAQGTSGQSATKDTSSGQSVPTQSITSVLSGQSHSAPRTSEARTIPPQTLFAGTSSSHTATNMLVTVGQNHSVANETPVPRISIPELSPTTVSEMPTLTNLSVSTDQNITTDDSTDEWIIKEEVKDINLEVIDLTWIDDGDQDELFEILDFKAFAFKSESEENEEVAVREACSPADSGLGSPKAPTHDDSFKCLCGQKALFVCACNISMYCSVSCQTKDWVYHRKLCFKSKN